MQATKVIAIVFTFFSLAMAAPTPQGIPADKVRTGGFSPKLIKPKLLKLPIGLERGGFILRIGMPDLDLEYSMRICIV
ncbi:hypothetical protein TWF569_002628 [Orbilia oligospora]|uniref:Uncharacterized protein n=1 Tax=Orbilia oligospora TaxID=2813651 RepID=A0A7C8JZ18_ORBOL|nr:hypothetical protein TWF706_003745 [Orbilia oligospora]KAF3106481.1 hypothetical protein TWF102_001431 [Orbilia oligospora]KAF3106609.1 hypothetical protein TWF103_006101 [Orbilia oligospora]KAF3140674.1 hypothetical protein TWF703_002880 [Orbilia oligospora]KAF3152802.1 hypothetical protein TWF569_002628 [Orbilia oligospora]